MFGLLIVISISCQNEKHAPIPLDRDTLEKELWRAIETRFYTWRNNDYNAHMETYHSDWHRWSLTSKKLLKKEDFVNLWKYAKNNEKVINMELEPIWFNILGNGDAAVVHFISKETFQWIGPSQLSIYGEEMKKDSVYVGTLRWSDVLVKENETWLCIGGHRDKSQLKNSLSK